MQDSKNLCAVCKKTSTSSCARCSQAYCSREHQTMDWPKHKSSCAYNRAENIRAIHIADVQKKIMGNLLIMSSTNPEPGFITVEITAHIDEFCQNRDDMWFAHLTWCAGGEPAAALTVVYKFWDHSVTSTVDKIRVQPHPEHASEWTVRL